MEIHEKQNQKISSSSLTLSENRERNVYSPMIPRRKFNRTSTPLPDRPRTRYAVRNLTQFRSHSGSQKVSASPNRFKKICDAGIIIIESDDEDEDLMEEIVFEKSDEDDEMACNPLHNEGIVNYQGHEELDYDEKAEYEEAANQQNEEIRDSPQSPEPEIQLDFATIGELDLNLERSMFNRIVLLNGVPMMQNNFISEREQLEMYCMFSEMCGYRLAINNVYEAMRERGYIEGPPAMTPDDFEQMDHIIRFINEKMKKYKDKHEEQQQQQQ